MSRFCEDVLTGLIFDLSRIMRIDPIIRSGTDKPYYTVHYNDGEKEKVSALSAGELNQSHMHLLNSWEHYKEWGC